MIIQHLSLLQSYTAGALQIVCTYTILLAQTQCAVSIAAQGTPAYQDQPKDTQSTAALHTELHLAFKSVRTDVLSTSAPGRGPAWEEGLFHGRAWHLQSRVQAPWATAVASWPLHRCHMPPSPLPQGRASLGPWVPSASNMPHMS